MDKNTFALCQRFADRYPMSREGQEMRDLLSEPQVSDWQVVEILDGARGTHALVTDAKAILEQLGVDELVHVS